MNVAGVMAALMAFAEQNPEAKLDPDLAASIIQVESNFDADAVGGVGELGYFQLRPEYFGAHVSNPKINLQVGLKHLLDIMERCPHKADNTWVICHNLGVAGAAKIKNPKQQTYYKKVMRAYVERKTSQVAAH